MKNKRVLAFMMAAAVGISLMTGCNSTGQKDSIETTAIEQVSETSETKAENGEKSSDLLASESPLELSIFMLVETAFDSEWEIFKEAAKMTNVSLKGTLSQSASDRDQAFNLMMSSKDLADIVQMTGRDIFNDYGKQGAFLDLAPLIEEHAPNLKAYLEEHPDTKKYLQTEDGEIFYICMILDGSAAKGWFIRQDWLDALELPVPETVDELYTTMKAFKEQDPNGNGKADEIPYFNRDSGVNYENSISDLLSLYDAYKGFGIRDGKVVYGPLEDQYKEAYENVSKWYAKGLIDPEIYTRGMNARDTLLAANTGGITMDWFSSTANYNDKLSGDIENFKFLPIAPPTATNGVKQIHSVRDTVGSDTGWAISSTCKNPVAAIKYFDFWFSEEGKLLGNYGVEGVHYNMIDGKPVFTDLVLNNPDMVPLDVIRSIGASKGIGYPQVFDHEKQMMNQIAQDGVTLYLDNGYPVEVMPPVNYTAKQERRLNQIIGSIETYISEYTQNWVLGNKDVSTTYNEFKATIESMGIQEAIEITQAAYEEYIK